MFRCLIVQDGKPSKVSLPEIPLIGDTFFTPSGFAKVVSVEQRQGDDPVFHLEKMVYLLRLPEMPRAFFRSFAWSKNSVPPSITIILCDLIRGICYDTLQQREFAFSRDEEVVIRDKLYSVGWACWSSVNKPNRVVVYIHLVEGRAVSRIPLADIPAPCPKMSKVRSLSKVSPIVDSARPCTPPAQVLPFTQSHIGMSLQQFLEQLFNAEEDGSILREDYQAFYATMGKSELDQLRKVLHSALNLISYQSSFKHVHLDRLRELSVAKRFALLFSVSVSYGARIPAAFNQICAGMSITQLDQYKGLFFTMLHDLSKMSTPKSPPKKTINPNKVHVLRQQQPCFANSEYQDLTAFSETGVPNSLPPGTVKVTPTKQRPMLPNFIVS